MEGHETGWTEVGGNIRSVIYSKLPHGSYRFQVKARNEDGVWNETGSSVALMANLLLTMMNRLGVNIDQIGDSNGMLAI